MGKTANYTVTLKLSSAFRKISYKPIDSKEFIEKYVKNIFFELLGDNTKVKSNVTVSENNDKHIININYTFFYSEYQISSLRIYTDEQMKDSNGNLELDEDDFMETMVNILSDGVKYILSDANINLRDWDVDDVSLKKDPISGSESRKEL